MQATTQTKKANTADHTSRAGIHAHSTPDPDIPTVTDPDTPTPVPPAVPVPDDVPAPTHAPVTEPGEPHQPVRT
jgi:hypothetical protein